MITQGGGGEFLSPTLKNQRGNQGWGQYATVRGLASDPERGGWTGHQQGEGGDLYPPNHQQGGPQGRKTQKVPLTIGNEDERMIYSRLSTEGGDRDQGMPI
jgi:hypothetical protein